MAFLTNFALLTSCASANGNASEAEPVAESRNIALGAARNVCRVGVRAQAEPTQGPDG